MENKIVEALCFGAKTWSSSSTTGFVVYHGIIIESEPSQIKFPLSKYKKNKVKKSYLKILPIKAQKKFSISLQKQVFS